MNLNTPSSELLKRYLTNQCSEQERAVVDEWYQGLKLDAGQTFSAADEKVLYDRIQHRIGETELDRKTVSLSFRKIWYYAAAALLIAGIFLANFSPVNNKSELAAKSAADSSQITFSNRQKKIVRYALPDKSTIWLQPGAVVSHPVSFLSCINREISFQGEGFFDVTRDVKHPFIIHCGKLQTKVLGTSFNIKAIRDEPDCKVSVVTGSVSVSKQNPDNKTETVILKPKQQAVFEKQTNRMTVHVSPASEAVNENWQSVSLIFDETPMSEVAVRLQQTFRIRIEFANPFIKKCRLKVDFNNQKLPEILGMIETLLGTSYEIEGDRVILKGEGCKN